MPDRNWPPTQRTVARGLQVMAYGWTTVAGLDVIFGSATNAPWWAVGLGFMAAVGGLVAAVASARGRWMTEWRACWFVLTAFICYAAVDASRLLFGAGSDLGTIAILGAASGWSGRRTIELWIFYLQTTRAHDTATGDIP